MPVVYLSKYSLIQLYNMPCFLLSMISQAWCAVLLANQLSPNRTKISLVWYNCPGIYATRPNGTYVCIYSINSTFVLKIVFSIT